MGLCEDLTIYVWNWSIWMKQVGGLTSCFMYGTWGLFWDDDDGAMMQWCWELQGPNEVTYPAYFRSSYATEE